MTREVEKVASAYFDLGGATALITGGASGLGKATADRMLRSNANVVIADYSDAGRQVADELDAKYDMSCRFIKTDVSKEEDIKAAVDYAVSCFGSLDILVASAGIGGANNAIADETLANWEKVNAVDYTGVMLADKYAIMQFLKQGHGGAICNLASMFGLVAVPSNVAYSAAKGGVVNLTKSAGTAYASHGIRVNCVCPGVINTPLVPEEEIPRDPSHAPHRRGLRDCFHHHLPLQPERPLHHRRSHPGRRRIYQRIKLENSLTQKRAMQNRIRPFCTALFSVLITSSRILPRHLPSSGEGCLPRWCIHAHSRRFLPPASSCTSIPESLLFR